MSDEPVGCAKPTGRVVGDSGSEEVQENADFKHEVKNMVQARVGQKAPDFEAPAYFKGKFTTVKLSDYFGKWVLVCFYPGDFTFV